MGKKKRDEAGVASEREKERGREREGWINE